MTTVDIVIPVLNEAHVIDGAVATLLEFLDARFPYPATVTIADNGSRDATLERAGALARTHPGVRVLHIDRPGRGGALRTAWSRSEADVVAYMDVDLSTGLQALADLVTPIVSDECDLAVGSRLAPGAVVDRTLRREFISRCYSLLLRATLRPPVRDAQCGFKAMRADLARQLLPAVVDSSWFFDTELIVLAHRLGLRVREVPVTWHEDPDSRVRVCRTARDDLAGIVRLLRDRHPTAGPVVARTSAGH